MTFYIEKNTYIKHNMCLFGRKHVSLSEEDTPTLNKIGTLVYGNKYVFTKVFVPEHKNSNGG